MAARPVLLLAVLVALLAAGCATSGAAPAQRGGAPTVRCLSEGDPSVPTAQRPLFFLFCIQSP